MRYLNQIYTTVPFCEIPRKDIPYLILRHDVDVSLSAALKMAQIEKDLGIRSTYFILFSSEFYNIFDGKNANILKQITKFGHEIGLHYDVSQYRFYGRNMNKTLRIQIKLLEHLIGKKVYSIARHGSWDRDPFTVIKGYVNANNPYLLRDLGIHDSCRAWTPLEGLLKLLNNPPRRVQLLIHPENWQDDKIDRETLMERFIQNSKKEILILKKNMRRAWLTDPWVLEYDRSIKNRNSMQSYVSGGKSEAQFSNRFQQELDYYNLLIRWYIINTSLGWRIHEILEKIRNILKLRARANTLMSFFFRKE